MATPPKKPTTTPPKKPTIAGPRPKINKEQAMVGSNRYQKQPKTAVPAVKFPARKDGKITITGSASSSGGKAGTKSLTRGTSMFQGPKIVDSKPKKKVK
jgi:hypothetical protein